jgi:peptidoglycan/LPS O-acetylase OafA/YrhL
MVEASGKRREARIAFLDYLRIFAFSSVLIGHKFLTYFQDIATNANAHASARLLASYLIPLFTGGGAGVVVFFLVSGYIITHVLQTERTLEFLVKRIFRIYPLYIVAVLLQYRSLSAAGHSPDLSVLWAQLSLFGDFFSTPVALNGVEWTLRVEVMFYLFMACMRLCGFTTRFKPLLPYLLIGATFMCGVLAPFPAGDVITKGYCTIYAPFLLVGAMFYLYEKGQAGLLGLSVAITSCFYEYFSLIAIYQSQWLVYHFAVLAFAIFAICFKFRVGFSAPAWVLVLSDMTYGVYLFHNWLFDDLKKILEDRGVNWFNRDLQALCALLVVCYLMMRFVERPAIRLGRRFLKLARIVS